MHNLAGFGRLFGGLGLALGALLIAIGLFVKEDPIDRLARERCEIERSIGRRAVPCPPAGGTERPLLLATGGSAIATGMLFLLLSGILATLVDIKDAQVAARSHPPAPRAVPPPEPARYVSPGAKPADGGRIGDPPAIPLPSRFEMITRHGEAIGGPAWDLMQQAAKAGIALPEADAVRKAREGPRHD